MYLLLSPLDFDLQGQSIHALQYMKNFPDIQSTQSLYEFLLGTQHRRGITSFVASLDSLQHGSLLDVMETRASISLPKLGTIHKGRLTGGGGAKADNSTKRQNELYSEVSKLYS